DRYPVEGAEVLREDADPGDDGAPLLGDVHPEKSHLSRRGRADRIDYLDGSSLAGAVRAQEGENFAFPDVERYAVDRQQIPITLGQVLDFDGMFSWVPHGFPFCLYRAQSGGTRVIGPTTRPGSLAAGPRRFLPASHQF